MKIIKKVLFVFFLCYIGYITFTNIFVGNFIDYETGAKASYSTKLNEVKRMASEYNAEELAETISLFTTRYQEKILHKNVILDSTIIGLEKTDELFYVKLNISNSFYGRVLANLQCDKDVFENLSNQQCKEFLIAADIKRIDICESELYAFSDKNEILAGVGKDILLSGSCLEIVELCAF